MGAPNLLLAPGAISPRYAPGLGDWYGNEEQTNIWKKLRLPWELQQKQNTLLSILLLDHILAWKVSQER